MLIDIKITKNIYNILRSDPTPEWHFFRRPAVRGASSLFAPPKVTSWDSQRQKRSWWSVDSWWMLMMWLQKKNEIEDSSSQLLSYSVQAYSQFLQVPKACWPVKKKARSSPKPLANLPAWDVPLVSTTPWKMPSDSRFAKFQMWQTQSHITSRIESI